MALENIKAAGKVIAGMRQTVKAIENDTALEVYIARDAEDKVTLPVIRLCQEKGIPIVYAETMTELGKACNIKVGAAMAAILKD